MLVFVAPLGCVICLVFGIQLAFGICGSAAPRPPCRADLSRRSPESACPEFIEGVEGAKAEARRAKAGALPLLLLRAANAGFRKTQCIKFLRFMLI
jgi:hypothetical protein